MADFITAFLLLAQTSYTHAAGASRNVVVLGDSLAAGYGVGAENAFPALLQEKIDAARLDAAVVNAGVSGDTSADGLRRLKWLMRQRIDVLIVELGANDGLRGLPVQSTEANLQAIVTQVREKYPNAGIILAGMRLPPNFGDAYVEAFRRIYPDLAAKNHAALVPFLLEGVGGIPDLNQADRIHPNVAGQKIVADVVWKVLLPVLETPAPAKG